MLSYGIHLICPSLEGLVLILVSILFCISPKFMVFSHLIYYKKGHAEQVRHLVELFQVLPYVH